ncbi:hypothetical protein [Streptomyces mirabilis]
MAVFVCASCGAALTARLSQVALPVHNARGGCRVGLAHAHGTTDQPVVLAGGAGNVIGASVDEDPTVRVAADGGGNPVQPPSADGLVSIYHPHCVVLLVHSLHHLPHGGHAATEPPG